MKMKMKNRTRNVGGLLLALGVMSGGLSAKESNSNEQEVPRGGLWEEVEKEKKADEGKKLSLKMKMGLNAQELKDLLGGIEIEGLGAAAEGAVVTGKVIVIGPNGEKLVQEFNSVEDMKKKLKDFDGKEANPDIDGLEFWMTDGMLNPASPEDFKKLQKLMEKGLRVEVQGGKLGTAPKLGSVFGKSLNTKKLEDRIEQLEKKLDQQSELLQKILE